MVADVLYEGTSAVARQGAPLPPLILSGSASRWKCGGTRLRLARFSTITTPSPSRALWTGHLGIAVDVRRKRVDPDGLHATLEQERDAVGAEAGPIRQEVDVVRP